MKKKAIISAIAAIMLVLPIVSGCGNKNNPVEREEAVIDAEPVPDSELNRSEEPDTMVMTSGTESGNITDEQALSAIRNYCYANNPELESIEEDGEYPVYWEIASSDENEIVVLFRSYTGAEIRYYIDPVSGETYVTEFVSGITDEEERTDESFNVKDYYESDAASGSASALTGTWQTVSMGYEADETIQPEYYVQFTDSDINYGHMKDGAFVLDHSDKIRLLEDTTAGGYRIQAESSNGTPYTYQTSEEDADLLEYYETWDEADFPEMYRAGASLSRCE